MCQSENLESTIPFLNDVVYVTPLNPNYCYTYNFFTRYFCLDLNDELCEMILVLTMRNITNAYPHGTLIS